MVTSLLELDDQLSAKIKSFKRGLTSGKWDDREVEKRLSTFAPIEEQIVDLPCTSLADLAVKARLAKWLNGDCLDGDTLAESVLATLVDDILRLERQKKTAAR